MPCIGCVNPLTSWEAIGACFDRSNFLDAIHKISSIYRPHRHIYDINRTSGQINCPTNKECALPGTGITGLCALVLCPFVYQCGEHPRQVLTYRGTINEKCALAGTGNHKSKYTSAIKATSDVLNTYISIAVKGIFKDPLMKKNATSMGAPVLLQGVLKNHSASKRFVGCLSETVMQRY